MQASLQIHPSPPGLQVWVTILSVYGQQQRRGLEQEGVMPVACALPGADGEGGDAAEEILRGMQARPPGSLLGDVGFWCACVGKTDEYDAYCRVSLTFFGSCIVWLVADCWERA